ncbi:MAG: aspartate aminotransferase family protein [Synergistaceae bacterium]|nr:aspartate aminotransferase family protein [Synergistaceae bacterium]
MKQMMENCEKHGFNNYTRYPVVFESAKNGYMIDVEGTKYLDFMAGIAVNSMGYDDEDFKNILKDQIGKIIHCSNIYYNAPMIRATELLSKATGFDKVFFCNSGAEANEGALKLARIFGKKSKNGATKIIAFANSFHGRTLGALSVTGQPKYREDFTPLIPDVFFAEYNNFDSVQKLIDDKVCGLIMEPIQGEGGVIPADVEFMKQIRELCTKENIMLIFDEVQTGIARSGKMFAFEHLGMRPDVLTLAKGLGGGVPIGAICADEKFARYFTPATHGTTFGGNPLATRAVEYVLSRISQKEFLENVKNSGEYFIEKFEILKQKHPMIKQIRGKGLLIGLVIDEKFSVADIVKKSFENHLLILSAGNNTLRFAPSLTITRDTIDKGLEILEKVLNSIEKA